MIDESLVKEALEVAQKLMDKPDVPSDKIYPLLNRLSSMYATLIYTSTLVTKEDAKKYQALASGIKEIIGTLKYQAKQNHEFRP